MKLALVQDLAVLPLLGGSRAGRRAVTAGQGRSPQLQSAPTAADKTTHPSCRLRQLPCMVATQLVRSQYIAIQCSQGVDGDGHPAAKKSTGSKRSVLSVGSCCLAPVPVPACLRHTINSRICPQAQGGGRRRPGRRGTWRGRPRAWRGGSGRGRPRRGRPRAGRRRPRRRRPGRRGWLGR